MKKLDLKGLKCPLPVLRLRRFLRDHMAIGEQVKVETSDPMAQLDIPHYCHENNQKLMFSKPYDPTTLHKSDHVFIVEKQS